MSFTIPIDLSGNTLAKASDVDANFAAVAAAINALGNILALPTGSPSGDTTLLTNALTLLATNGGGITGQPDSTTKRGAGGRLIIPQYQYQLQASTTGLLVPSQALIEAAGYGGPPGGGSGENAFFHFIISGVGSAGDAGLVALNLTGPHTTGGAKLARIAFHWATTNSTDTAINLALWSAYAEECDFDGVPVIVSFGQLPNGGVHGQDGLASEIRKCNSKYGNNSGAPDYVTHIWMAGEQGGIRGPCIFLFGTDYTLPGALTHCVCIGIGGSLKGSEHQIIEGGHITGWPYGIDYADINNVGLSNANTPGAQHTTVREMQINCLKTAVNGSPSVRGGKLYNQTYIGNTITKITNSTDNCPIFLIDTNNGANTNVADWSLIANTIYSGVASSHGHGGVAQSNQYGVQVNGGSGIRIALNRIGQCGGADPSVVGTANIAITSSYTFPYFGIGSPGYPSMGRPPVTGQRLTSVTSGPTGLLIEGNDLRPAFADVDGTTDTGAQGSGPSDYAILVTGTQNGIIQIRDNNMTQYAGSSDISKAAFFVDPSAIINGTIDVTDNPGYNDQAYLLNGGNIPTVGTTASTCSTPYWGPSEAMFTNGNSGGTVTVHYAGNNYVIPPGGQFYRYFRYNWSGWFVTVSGGATIANLLANYKWLGK